mmetsp:Transcript_9366/g.15110  ORF Transcript_9366/g.15110 Transcript_9366/m.15110 type:complete len:387 (+) Transcript_9366:43-1203(+)
MDHSPPLKKRKLNDEDVDYLPSENESEELPSDDEESEYEPSDKADSEEPGKRRILNTNSNAKKRKTDEEKEEEFDNDSDEENDELSELSSIDKHELKDLLQTIGSFTATQLKAVLKILKSLRAIDGEAVFEDLKVTGSKDELQDAVIENLSMIYKKKIVVKSTEYFFHRSKEYNEENVDFKGWKLQIKQSLNLIASKSRSSRSKKSKGKALSAALMSKLNASDKCQIIAALELLFEQQENGKSLADTFEALLPKPSLEDAFRRHNALIAAIGKAQPWTRYGSSRDSYCFKRCRSAINTAKKAILEDGKSIIDSKEWTAALEFLVVTIANIDKFPVWDCDANNAAVRDLNKKMKVWFGKVKTGLGQNADAVQQKRLQKVEQYVAALK